MKQFKLFVQVLLILVVILMISSKVDASPSGFVKVELTDDLSKLNFEGLILNPEVDPDYCTINSERVVCDRFIGFKSKSWYRFEETQSPANDLPQTLEYLGGFRIHPAPLNWYIALNPESEFNYIQDCTSIASGQGISASIGIWKEGDAVRTRDNRIEIEMTYDFIRNMTSPCITFKFPFRSPELLESNTFFYPFDEYTFSYGFEHNNMTFLMEEITLPEEFRFSFVNFSDKPDDKFFEKNIGLIVFKNASITGEHWYETEIKIKRNDDNKSFFYNLFLLSIIPITFLMYLIIGKFTKETFWGIYIGVAPALLIYFEYFKNKPGGFTLVEISFAISIGLFFINIIHDLIKNIRNKGNDPEEPYTIQWDKRYYVEIK